MRPPSASKIGLALECLHPFTATTRWPKEVGPKPHLDFGVACHDVSELTCQASAVNTPAIAKARGLTSADSKRLGPTGGVIVDYLTGLVEDGYTLWPEVAIAYDVETGKARALRQEHHRDYSDRRKTELTCTVDIVAIRGSEVVVKDWKTGKRIDHEDESSAQMMFCGLAVARFLGVDCVRVELLYVDEKGVFPDGCDLDDWSLEAFESERLRPLWKRLHAGPAGPTPGDHCTKSYCPLLGHCSATRQALVEVIRPDMPLLARIDSPEAAAKARLALAHAEATIRAVKARIDEIATHEPLLMPNGKYYGKVRTEKETVDNDNPNTLRVIQELLGDRWMEAVEFSSSKAAIERVVGTGKKSLPVINAMRAAGVMKRSGYDSFKEFTKSNDTEQEKEAS